MTITTEKAVRILRALCDVTDLNAIDDHGAIVLGNQTFGEAVEDIIKMLETQRKSVVRSNQEVEAIIQQHIATYNHSIEDCQASIRESYARMQTNVDSRRDAISRYEERKHALQALLKEMA